MYAMMVVILLQTAIVKLISLNIENKKNVEKELTWHNWRTEGA